MPKVLVDRVTIPVGSTIAIASGLTDDGTVRVEFALDWRAASDMAEAMGEGALVVADVPEYAVVDRHEIDPTTGE